MQMILIFSLLGLMTLSILLIKLLIVRYQRIGRFDVPNDRSMHVQKTPTGAGIVIVGLLLLVCCVLLITFKATQLMPLAIIIASLAVIGWFDDKSNLSIKIRFLAFLVVGIFLLFTIGMIDDLSVASIKLVLPALLAAVLTLFGFVWLINLYNFMDGMDGLAGMQTVIAAGAFSFLFAQAESPIANLAMLLCMSLIALTLGFLVWNWSPAKIFLGDVGSLPIGGLFGVLTILAVNEVGVSIYSCILILLVFVFDTAYTLILRAMRGENITQAHSSHIYQRLAKAGMPHYQVVLFYSLLMLCFASLAVLLEQGIITGVLTGVIASIGVVSLLVAVKVLSKQYLK